MRKLLGLFIVLFFASTASAAELTEPQKISALLDAFATSDVTLVRNGEEHDGKYARKHFEEKLKQTKDVKTAEDFIAKVATDSSHTGKPYIVKLKDGTQLESAKWLHAKLKEIEAPKKAG